MRIHDDMVKHLVKIRLPIPHQNSVLLAWIDIAISVSFLPN